MKSILKKVAGIAIATVLAFGMFSCNIGNKEEPTPTEITLTCKKCGEDHIIDIKDCTTWQDVSKKPGVYIVCDRAYYDPCQDYIKANGDYIFASAAIDTKAKYTVGD